MGFGGWLDPAWWYPGGVDCLVLHGRSLGLKRPLLTFAVFGMEKFSSLLFELDWPPLTVGLGSARPADFVRLFNSGAWFSVQEPLLPFALDQSPVSKEQQLSSEY